ncbi:AIP3-domain-containing protein, partial [Piedraia hortae CBS 480.64]
RRSQQGQQVATIEKSVTNLLIATKELLETLTLWSRRTATETQVSDVYVRLGYEFNIATRAFNAIGVDTGDLGPVPDLLRVILEETLSQEASQASLERYLPRIRDIIINLLHGLKKKQQRLRQRSAADGRPARHMSGSSSSGSVNSNLTEQLAQLPSRTPSTRVAEPVAVGETETGGEWPTSPRRNNNSPRTSGRPVGINMGASSLSLPDMPGAVPYPDSDAMPSGPADADGSQAPRRPPPRQNNDALTTLQRSGELERRASRRFSQYQIHKQLGPGMNGIPTIPPAQHTPVPNRNRDVRESLIAVRSRGTGIHGRRNNGLDKSPNRMDTRRISEQSEEMSNDGFPAPSIRQPQGTNVQPSEDGAEKTIDGQKATPATLNGPPEDSGTLDSTVQEPEDDGGLKRELSRRRMGSVLDASMQQQIQQFVPENSPQPGKPLTLFLQYKTQIKKLVLPDGGDLTIGKLQLAFIEKFAWSTHNHGVDLPDIYIQDPVSGVRYELEDLSDIKENSVLVLNVEALEEIRRLMDDQLGGIRRIVEGIKTGVDNQHTALELVSRRQQTTATELAGLAAAQRSAPQASQVGVVKGGKVRDPSSQLEEVQRMRRDLAVVRQTYSSFVTDMEASMAQIRSKAANVKQAAMEAAIPAADGSDSRGTISKGVAEMAATGEELLDRVEEMQDQVEDIRRDVLTRGVRPHPRQLEAVGKEVAQMTMELKKHIENMKKQKPIWTKRWERDLEVVCDEKELLTVQAELGNDLQHDMQKAAETFRLVEQACKQQSLQSGHTSSGRALNTLAMDRGADPKEAQVGVLSEVRALQPNHESRLEAIERAERARQKELESRKGGELQRALDNFNEEGGLKKSGGVEEVERVRKLREEKARREAWELQQERARNAATLSFRSQEAPPQPKVEDNLPQGETSETTVPPPAPPPKDQPQNPSSSELAPPPPPSADRDVSPEGSIFVEAREDID